jgi:antitoxin CptB
MSEETLDVRRKRLRFRAWHRGTKEMDLIMGKFADTHIETLNTTDLDQFEALLEEADDTVYGWIAKRTPVPDEFDNDIYKRLCRLDFMGDIPSYPHDD